LVGLLVGLAVPVARAAAPARTGTETSPATPPGAITTREALGGVATIGFDFGTLSALGLEVTDLTGDIGWHQPHSLSVIPLMAPAFEIDRPVDLRIAVAEDGFRGFAGGGLRLRGGFRLRGGAVGFDFSRLALRPGAAPTALELVDSEGVAVLATGDAQWELDARGGVLHYLNADLRLLPEAARRLGEPRYAGVAVGVLDVDLEILAGDLPAPSFAVNSPPPCGDWSGSVDVALTDMSSIGQGGIATVNGRSVVVVLPSASLHNSGTANVPWYSKFTNLGVPPWNDQHPFLVWQMLRASADGVLEPLGKSDLKHAFLTVNSGCDAGACTDSHILGLGCSDVYGTSTNNSVGSLAPRAEVTAATGIWNHCGGIATHFDTNGDCVQDFSGSGENAFTHGLKAAEADLTLAGASYYVEAFYIVRNDVNIFNSMGYRQVAPAKPSSTWTFPTVGSYAQGPAVNAWVNPAAPGPNADNRVLDTGTGHLQLAVRVTDVAGVPGRHRYAYALQNHDFDRQIRSFHVPLWAEAIAGNIAYADGDGFATDDWTATVDATGITWTAPAATTPPAELDFATLIAFRFDSDFPPSAVPATLGVFEAGSPMELQIQTLGPAAGLFADDFEDGDVVGWALAP
jgi:hypothetical protein